MENTAKFQFGENSLAIADHDKVVRIPKDINGFEVLFNLYDDQLELPGYTGRNWNSLLDCLRDLSWLDQQRIVIIHENIPRLPSHELYTYLDVLKSCISSWKPDEAHAVVVVFPETSRDELEAS